MQKRNLSSVPDLSEIARNPERLSVVSDKVLAALVTAATAALAAISAEYLRRAADAPEVSAPLAVKPIEAAPTAMIRPREAAMRLSISRVTLWRLSRSGVLPAPVRLGKRAIAWRAADLDAWLARQ